MESSNDSWCVFVCVCCMCRVMREGKCEKSNEVCHAFDGLVEGIDSKHSIEYSQSLYLRLYQAIERKLTKRNIPVVVRKQS